MIRPSALVAVTLMLPACGGGTATRLSSEPGPSSKAGAEATAAPSPTSAPTSACKTAPTTGNSLVMVDFVDFVQLDGRQYIADREPKPAPAAADIGSVVGEVACELSTLKYTEAPGPSADGDAAFLPKGTAVHAVRGFDPSCRVAARIEGAYRVYLAHHDVNGVSTPVPCASG